MQYQGPFSWFFSPFLALSLEVGNTGKFQSPIVSSRAPIGIFDSGIGGLTVLAALLRRLPNEDYIYLGDTARVPYGTKSRETVIKYSIRITQFLERQAIKLLVVACNTASAHAMDELRTVFPDLPIVGVIEPGAQAAFTQSHSKRIAILATEGTIRSEAYRRALQALGPVEVVNQPCPLFVPLAEEGWVDDEVARLVAERYLAPVRQLGVDTAVLGCTHYPLLANTIGAVLGPTIRLVDSAATTAEAVERHLQQLRLQSEAVAPGRVRFLLTDTANRFVIVGARFLGWAPAPIEPVDL